MMTDRELLHRYARDASEEAFAEIVRRHVNLVYGTALRQLCGNGTLAQDVTQAVFAALAAKPATALRIRHLSAWLYRTTRFTVSHTVRAERRRQDREQKAHTMHALLADSGSDDTPQVPPELLDQVLERLDDADREAILLRFFEGQSFAAIGSALAVTEDAARMRVTRALEKIRSHFEKNGITSSATALGAALTHQAIAAPANFAASVSCAALAGNAAMTAAAGAKLGLLTFMTTTKTIAWTAGAAAVAAFGLAGYQQREATLRNEQIATLVAAQQRADEDRQQAQQRAKQAEQRAIQAEQRLADLQRKTMDAPAPKPLPLTPHAAPAAPLRSAEDAARLAEKMERMARMKPLLEAGTPIKGAVVVLVDGKAVPRPVEFVIGKETRIENVDDGTYIVTPTLNPDGSVKYQLAVARRTSVGEEHIEKLPTVIQTPWEGFTLSSRGGVVAFDPEMSPP